MYIVVGLGNPGKKYDNTRHNVGFDFIDYVASEYGITMNKLKFKAIIGEKNINGQKVMLVKPQTYMNLSGESVREILNFYKDVDSTNLIVVYDDIDFEVGKTKIRKKGSAGTHNGMKSIIYQIQTDNFPRVRIGIGKPPFKDYDLADYVLGKFTTDERKLVNENIKDFKDALDMIISDGIDKAMNKYNR